MIISCDWSVKDNDNESNSQPKGHFSLPCVCCDWSVKDNDNESNSQLTFFFPFGYLSCDWSVKDNDNESNSQPLHRADSSGGVVIGLSKIMIMKAIHNIGASMGATRSVVIGLSKIMIMKAIHNSTRVCQEM